MWGGCIFKKITNTPFQPLEKLLKFIDYEHHSGEYGMCTSKLYVDHNVCYLPTNADTVLHSGLTSSLLQALTSKVYIVSGLSPDFLAMTVAVVDPFTIFSLQQPFSLSLKRIWYFVTFPVCTALAGGSHFSVTEGLCESTVAIRFWTGSGVRAVE